MLTFAFVLGVQCLLLFLTTSRKCLQLLEQHHTSVHVALVARMYSGSYELPVAMCH